MEDSLLSLPRDDSPPSNWENKEALDFCVFPNSVVKPAFSSLIRLVHKSLHIHDGAMHRACSDGLLLIACRNAIDEKTPINAIEHSFGDHRLAYAGRRSVLHMNGCADRRLPIFAI